MLKNRADQAWDDWFDNEHPSCGKWHTDLASAPKSLDAVSVTGKTATFERLADFPALRRLQVRQVSQTQLEAIADLSRLTELRVFGFQGADAAPLANLKRLEILTVEWAPKIETLSWISALDRLRFLRLGDLKRIEDLSAVGELASLRYLSISGGNERVQSIASVAPLARLRKLEQLVLVARVADDDLSPLAAMTWLKWLWLNDLHPVRVYAELTAALTRTECAAFSPTRTLSVGRDRYVVLTGKPSRQFKAGDPKSLAPIAKREAEFARWLKHYRATHRA